MRRRKKRIYETCLKPFKSAAQTVEQAQTSIFAKPEARQGTVAQAQPLEGHAIPTSTKLRGHQFGGIQLFPTDTHAENSSVTSSVPRKPPVGQTDKAVNVGSGQGGLQNGCHSQQGTRYKQAFAAQRRVVASGPVMRLQLQCLKELPVSSAHEKPVDLQPKGSGRPLPDKIVNSFAKAGYPEVANARVHVDDKAAQSIQASAYTTGSDIVVQSSDADNVETLGHEATHIVHQANRQVRPTIDGTPINDDSTMEQEADANGKRISQDQPVTMQRKKKEKEATSANDESDTKTPVSLQLSPTNAVQRGFETKDSRGTPTAWTPKDEDAAKYRSSKENAKANPIKSKHRAGTMTVGLENEWSKKNLTVSNEATDKALTNAPDTQTTSSSSLRPQEDSPPNSQSGTVASSYASYASSSAKPQPQKIQGGTGSKKASKVKDQASTTDRPLKKASSSSSPSAKSQPQDKSKKGKKEKNKPTQVLVEKVEGKDLKNHDILFQTSNFNYQYETQDKDDVSIGQIEAVTRFDEGHKSVINMENHPGDLPNQIDEIRRVSQCIKESEGELSVNLLVGKLVSNGIQAQALKGEAKLNRGQTQEITELPQSTVTHELQVLPDLFRARGASGEDQTPGEGFDRATEDQGFRKKIMGEAAKEAETLLTKLKEKEPPTKEEQQPPEMAAPANAPSSSPSSSPPPREHQPPPMPAPENDDLSSSSSPAATSSLPRRNERMPASENQSSFPSLSLGKDPQLQEIGNTFNTFTSHEDPSNDSAPSSLLEMMDASRPKTPAQMLGQSPSSSSSSPSLPPVNSKQGDGNASQPAKGNSDRKMRRVKGFLTLLCQDMLSLVARADSKTFSEKSITRETTWIKDYYGLLNKTPTAHLFTDGLRLRDQQWLASQKDVIKEHMKNMLNQHLGSGKAPKPSGKAPKPSGKAPKPSGKASKVSEQEPTESDFAIKVTGKNLCSKKDTRKQVDGYLEHIFKGVTLEDNTEEKQQWEDEGVAYWRWLMDEENALPIYQYDQYGAPGKEHTYLRTAFEYRQLDPRVITQNDKNPLEEHLKKVKTLPTEAGLRQEITPASKEEKRDTQPDNNSLEDITNSTSPSSPTSLSSSLPRPTSSDSDHRQSRSSPSKVSNIRSLLERTKNNPVTSSTLPRSSRKQRPMSAEENQDRQTPARSVSSPTSSISSIDAYTPRDHSFPALTIGENKLINSSLSSPQPKTPSAQTPSIEELINTAKDNMGLHEKDSSERKFYEEIIPRLEKNKGQPNSRKFLDIGLIIQSVETSVLLGTETCFNNQAQEVLTMLDNNTSTSSGRRSSIPRR